jgi:hypothetical protein
MIRENKEIQGTLPTSPHPNHLSAGLGSCAHAPALGQILLSDIFSLSGTLAPEWGCSNNATSFSTSVLIAVTGTRISGTLPPCMFTGLTRADTVNLDSNVLTGAIPAMAHSTLLRQIRVANNGFQSFPDRFPASLEQFTADNNPEIDISGSGLSRLLATAPALKDFSFMVDKTLSIAWTEILQHGAIPMMIWSQLQPVIPLDCRVGEHCGLKLMIVLGIQYRPLRSIGIDFTIKMSPVVELFDEHTSNLTASLFGNGTSSDAQNASTGRRRSQSAIQIDTQNIVTSDNSNMSDRNTTILREAQKRSELSMHIDDLNVTIPMRDTDDGDVHVDFPKHLFPISGRYHFRLFARRSSCLGQDTPPAGSGLTPTPLNPTPCMEHLIELADKSLWHVNMHPIDCMSSYASPDEAGTTCRCHPGYGAPTGQQPCQLGERECECPQCLNGFFSSDGIMCQACPKGTVSNHNKTGCVCEPGRYNASMGTVTCIDQNYKDNEFYQNPLYAVAAAEFNSGIECIECPICVDCLSEPGTLTLQPGFHQSPSAHKEMKDMAQPFNKTFLRCRPETAHTDGLGKIDGNGYDAMGEGKLPAVQCVGGPLQKDGLKCAIGHTGTLCGECAEGYGRKNVNQCVSCKDTLDPKQILKICSLVALGIFLVVLAMIALSFAIGDVYEEIDVAQAKQGVAEQRYTNPVHDDSPAGEPGSPSLLSNTDRQPSSDLEALPSAGTQAPATVDVIDAIDVIFAELDQDESGTLDIEEVRKLTRRLGMHLGAKKLAAAMNAMDSDGSGAVDRLELRRWIATLNTRRATRVVSSHTIIRTSKRLLASGLSMSIQPMKLFLSYWQIAAHMGAVLHFQFPPMIGELFTIFKPLVANIHGVVALECAGLRNFYSAWVVEVFIIPTVLWGIVLCFYMYRKRIAGPSIAISNFRNEAFFVLFMVYPFITNKLFGVLNCRRVGPDDEVLVSDYTIDCDTPTHTTLEYVSVTMIFAFSVSVPLVMAIVVAKNRAEQHKQFSAPTWQYIARRAMAQLGHDNVDEIKNSIIDITLGNRYGSLISAFKPGVYVFVPRPVNLIVVCADASTHTGFFYWECLDMGRKLVLVGLLTSIERGSTLQVCTGLVFSFVFFAAHMRTMPYRHAEDNVLKACTEVHLFIILMLVLTLKSDLHGERFSVDDYDMFATVMFILLVPCIAFLCIWHKWRVVVRDDIDSTKDLTHTARLQKAFHRQRLGRDKDEDRALLAAYFAKMLDEVNNHFHVFISYRVASEAKFAKSLFDALSTMTLAETGQKLRVYLDQVRLEDGQRWDQGFMSGLAASWIMVPIVSSKALVPMTSLNKSEDTAVDNVLLEWMVGLELHARDDMRAIIPVIACDDSGEEFSWGLPKELSNEQHEPTVAATKMHLLKVPSSLDCASESNLLDGVAQTVSEVMQDSIAGVSVAGVVNAILRYQGVLLTDRADLAKCTGRIFEKVSDILSGDAQEDESTPKGNKKKSPLDTSEERE